MAVYPGNIVNSEQVLSLWIKGFNWLTHIYQIPLTPFAKGGKLAGKKRFHPQMVQRSGMWVYPGNPFAGFSIKPLQINLLTEGRKCIAPVLYQK